MTALFSPDGRYVVTSSADKTARVWNVQTGRLFAELRGHIASVNTAQFSHDGNYVLTSGDRTARVWDVTRRVGEQISGGTVAIGPNHTFDFDLGVQDSTPYRATSSTDMSWRIGVKSGSRSETWSLHPHNTAQFAFLTDPKGTGVTNERNFDSIGVTELVGLNYSATPITGGFLTEGQTGPLNKGYILAVRTSDGNYAKVEVLERYNILKIRWVTYKAPEQRLPARAEKIQPLVPTGKRFEDLRGLIFGDATGKIVWRVPIRRRNPCSWPS